MLARLRTYLALTKPTIMVLVVITGATGLVLQQDFTYQPWSALLVLCGLFLTGGSANALNQYFERDLDARMERTSKRRPLPMHRLGPNEALFFAVAIGVAGVLLFGLCFNLLSAALAGGTILFYGLFYTLYLKPRTAQNIVIGGAAGAMAPVIAWAAAAGDLSLTPWVLFLVIFLWTPPHFWALALYLREDYEAVAQRGMVEPARAAVRAGGARPGGAVPAARLAGPGRKVAPAGDRPVQVLDPLPLRPLLRHHRPRDGRSGPLRGERKLHARHLMPCAGFL